jgi:delta8-fatty-acid desaturase
MAALLAGAVWLVLATTSVAAHMAAAVMLGFLWMQSGFLGHDSGHYVVMRTGVLNRAVQLVAGNRVAGISIGWWKRNHNAHHIACNSLDQDLDVQHTLLFAVSPRLFASLTSAFYRRAMRFDAGRRRVLGVVPVAGVPAARRRPRARRLRAAELRRHGDPARAVLPQPLLGGDVRGAAPRR